MTIVLGIGFVVELALSIYLLKVVHRHEWAIFNREFKIEALQRKIDGYKESAEVLSTSVRKLNGVVKDLEQKPKPESENSIDTRAFIAGWDADEPEPLPQLISKEEWMQLAKANLNCQRIDPLLQQCIYPLQTGQLQASAMLPPQQCIYPWQQTPTGAMLPLWYINRRLEEM